MPTRGRPSQSLAMLSMYRKKAGAPIAIEVVIDRDDAVMFKPDVQERLKELECIVTVGDHKSKVEAVNGGVVSDWDILLLASDDMVPVVDGYAARVLSAMEEHWPHLDGALYFDDGYQAKQICTLPIFGRRLHDQFNFIYEREYTSLFCDGEQTAILSAMGRLRYINEKIIEHRHPVVGKAHMDALYSKNEGFWKVDQAVYNRRKEMIRPRSQFRFDAPPYWLSICIATIEKRRPMLDTLVVSLYDQIIEHAPREVEVLIDGGEGSVGVKRQRLLESAQGHFIVYIDDDDAVAADYIQRIVPALRENPDADCTSLRGIMTTDGQKPMVMDHSIKNPKWVTSDGIHFRTPNHINPIKRKLALEVGFKDLSHGEDSDYSTRIKPLLETEIPMGDAPLYIYQFRSRK